MASAADAVKTMFSQLLLTAVKEHTKEVVAGVILNMKDPAAALQQVDMEGKTLLHHAAQHPSGQQAFEICELLVKQHGLRAAALDKHKQSAVFYAAKEGKAQLCELLVDAGCAVDRVDTGGQTPLFYAVRYGHIGAADVFLSRGANVDVVDNKGYTPIFWAADSGKVKMMKHLVEKGANTKQLTYIRGDIFTSATGPAMAYALEELGCDPLRRLIKNQTNLFAAAKRGDVDKIQALIEIHRLDVNHIDDNGQTCLYYAATYGGPIVTQKLVTVFKADALITDQQGRTPKAYIMERNGQKCDPQVIKILTDAEKKQKKAQQDRARKQREAALKERKRQEQAEKARKKAEEAQARREAKEAANRAREEEAQRAQQEAASSSQRAPASSSQPAPASGSRRRKRSTSDEDAANGQRRKRYRMALRVNRQLVDPNSEQYAGALEEVLQAMPFLRQPKRRQRRQR